jgi:hypothetical protein
MRAAARPGPDWLVEFGPFSVVGSAGAMIH